MNPNQMFYATDKLNRKYLYEYIGINDSDNGCDVNLYNHTLQQQTLTENLWFTTRQIELVGIAP